MLTSVIHDFFHWQTRCHIEADCHQCWIGKSVALTDYEGILSTKQEMTLVDSVVMDEGNSCVVPSFCKPIIYKLSFREGMKESSMLTTLPLLRSRALLITSLDPESTAAVYPWL
jgi:hypothetical protein